jgi:predicted DsbA family dithiol-disulfide isomerase
MTGAPTPLRIDFVSDITCPWCAIGLTALLRAIAQLRDEVPVDLQLQPFELNPGLPHEGEAIAAYAARKYGAGADELAARQALIRQRAAEFGLDFRLRTHVYNTFDAHRLLHWAASQGRQLELKQALLRAYHERGENPASPEVLLAAAVEAGLDRLAAGDVLGRGAHGDEVKSTVRRWQRLGLDGVPAAVIDGRQLVPGAQPVEVYAQALREAAARR